jgi:hypothetical protein
MEVDNLIKLDYSLEKPEDRNELVKQILQENPEPNEKYLEILADYLILCMEKQEKKEKKILTDNRMTTVNKRETSFEGLISQFENGEDGIYNLVTNDKNVIFQPKISITKKDLEEIQPLRQLKEAITIWENKQKTATGKEAYIIKRTLIDLRKDQYIIKNAYRKPIVPIKLIHSKHVIHLDGKVQIDEETGEITYSGFTFLDPKVCEQILCNYSKLKEDSYGNFENDTWYMINDFEKLCDKALENYPLYMRLVEYKIDGMPNLDIQDALQVEFGIKHSIEYISSLWRNKIPKLIASAAEDEWLNYHFTMEEKGKFKRCSRCGKIKLAHNKYFSKNKTSKDSFYSICKECRNAGTKKNAVGQKPLIDNILLL